MQFVLAADAAILRQAQHRHHVNALDRRLIARVDDEDFDRVLFLEHQVGDDRRQHRPALGQDADLHRLAFEGVRPRRLLARHSGGDPPKSSSSRGRIARSAASDSGLMRTFSSM